MLILGIDIGTSSIKASVVDASTQRCIASAQYPETENEIIALEPGWAEQSPAIENTIIKTNNQLIKKLKYVNHYRQKRIL